MKTRSRSFLIGYILCAILSATVLLGVVTVDPVQAIDESTTVTALVPDNIAPSTPILISPTNGSILNDDTPTFVWQASTDNVAMASYTLTVDGSVLFSSIPVTSTTNGQYTLVYNSGDSTYSLTPTSNLANGVHTWKITAYDSSDNSTDSVTWSFTIDTQAPVFVVTQIGNQTVSISSQDVSTIPSSPIELEDNEPEIAGTGEVDADVVMTVTIPDEPTQTFTFTIGSSGDWSVQLGVLPRGVTMYLSFTITDGAGNVSVLNNIPFLIKEIIIVFPPQPSPSPTPTPTPASTPNATITPLPSAPPTTPLPTATPSGPIISIPITPPRESVIRIAQRVEQQLPPVIRDIIEILPNGLREAIIEPVRLVAPVSALIATAAIPSLSLLNLLLEFGGQLSWRLLVKILQAIGLLPPSEPQGLVFNAETYEPVSYALLTFRSTHQELDEQILETAISDENGVYQGIELPSGEYTLTVDHQDYHFPTTKPRPSYLTLREFYRGELFYLDTRSSEPLFLVPVDSLLHKRSDKTWRDRLRLFAARFKLRNLVLPLFIFSCVVTLFYPTVLNFIILGMYLILFGRRLFIRSRTPLLAGTVTDSHGMGIENAIIRVTDEVTGQTRVLLRTDENGQFATRITTGVYQLAVSKLGYVWVEDNQAVSYREAVATRTSAPLAITLKPIQEVLIPV